MDERRLGMIGLGLLGSALCERFLAAGFEVVGYDIDPERCREQQARGARIATSAADVIASAERLVLSLPTSGIVAQVIDDCAATLRAGQIIIDTTTGEPDSTARLGEVLSRRNVAYLDATVAGSSDEVRRGAAIVMAGGDRAAFDACADCFASFAARWFHLGGWGAGARMKLAVNLVLGLNRAALAEGLAFAQRLQLDPRTTLEVFKCSAAYSRAMDHKGEKMIQQDFAPQARLAQHLKDVQLILSAGQKAGAVLPLSAVHCDLLEQLEKAGLGDADNSAIIKAFQ